MVDVSPSGRHRVVTVTGLVVVALYIGLVLWGIDRGSYNTWSALIIGPVLVAGIVPLLRRQAEREADPKLFHLLLVALGLKMIGSLARYWVAYGLYEGATDAQGYHEAGMRIAGELIDSPLLIVSYVLHSTGTNFVETLNGIIYVVTGPALLSSFLIFSTLSFIGMFLFYRAFVIALPGGRSRTYARLLFFLPSMLFWPSSVGKEAWLIFALGLASFGVARAIVGVRSGMMRGFILAAAGMALAMQVRPHIAALIGISLSAVFLIRRPSASLRQLAPIFKLASILLVVVVAAVLVVRMQSFLTEDSGIDTAAGVQGTAGAINERTAQGGSEFSAPNVLENPAHAPAALVTVLYRPFVFEADSLVQLGVALEGMFLLLLTLRRWRTIWSAISSMRSSPFIAYAFTFAGLFIIAFSSIGNFGILTRQRVQLYPFVLVLLAWPLVARRKPEEHSLVDELDVAR